MKKILTIIGLFLFMAGYAQKSDKIEYLRVDSLLYSGSMADPDTLITPHPTTADQYKYMNVADPENDLDAVNFRTFVAAISGLNLTEITDPSASEATSTAIIDTAQGVIVTLTSDGADQVMQQPTDKKRRNFIFINDSQSSGNIAVSYNDGTETKLIQPGNFNVFIYDSLQWVGNNITSVTTTNINGTGLFEGGIIDTITGDATTYNISAGDGIIIDNTTDHERPSITYVSWTAFLDQTPSFLNTEPRTYIGIDVNGSLIQQSADFTNSQKRALICLGSVGHPDEATVTSAINTPVYAVDRVLMPVDLASAIGNINAGNSYSGVNATNTLNKTSGATFRLGANYANDTSNPNETTDPAVNPVGFVYVWGDGVGGLSFGTGTTAVSGTLYDDGSGTPASVPSNKFTNQRIFYFPGTNLSFIILGQTVYNTLDAAVLAAPSETFSIPVSQTEGASARSIISIRNNFTTFTDPNTDLTTYKFTELSKFGEISTGGSAGATDLQTAYNNSVQPQIVTDSGRGALQVKSGTGDDADNVQEWLNNAGSVIGEIDGNGDLSTNNLSGTNTGDDPTAYLPLTGGTLSGGVFVNTGSANNNNFKVQASSQTSRTYGLGINSSSGFVIYDNLAASERFVISTSGNSTSLGYMSADSYSTNVQTLTETSGAVAWDMSSGSKAKVTIDETSVITITNMPEGAEATIRIVQGDAGDDNVTFVLSGATVEWRGDDTDLTDDSGAVDYISVINMDGFLGVTLGSGYVTQ